MESITQTLINSPIASVIFVVNILLSYRAFQDFELKGKLMLNPYLVANQKQYYRLISSGFIHADTTHLLFNMLTFYFFAFYVEMFLGSFQFLVFYFASLFISDISSVIKHQHNPSYNSLGASGAVSAIVLAFIVLNPTAMLGLYFIIPIPAWLFGILYIGYSYYSSRNSYDNINHDAHLWGAIAGIGLTFLLQPRLVLVYIDMIQSFLS